MNDGAGLVRRCLAEGLGTAFLLTTIVGAGIMGSRLSGGNAAITLLADSLATGIVLALLILVLSPLSGAHMNPAVTVLEFLRRRGSRSALAGYLAAQIGGAMAGVALAHLMFGAGVFNVSHRSRGGAAQALSEFVATFGLFVVLRGTARLAVGTRAVAAGSYITAAYWFTASTSFANPAVTLARSLTDTFAGIRPGDVPWFIVAQCLGAAAATGVMSGEP